MRFRSQDGKFLRAAELGVLSSALFMVALPLCERLRVAIEQRKAQRAWHMTRLFGWVTLLALLALPTLAAAWARGLRSRRSAPPHPSRYQRQSPLPPPPLRHR